METNPEQREVDTQRNDASFDLSPFSPIFVSSTHLEIDELHDLEDALLSYGAVLTYDMSEASVVLTKVIKKARVRFDMRVNGIWTVEVTSEDSTLQGLDQSHARRGPSRKRKRGMAQAVEQEQHQDENDAAIVIESSTDSELDTSATLSETHDDGSLVPSTSQPKTVQQDLAPHVIKVVQVAWFTESKALQKLLPIEDYVTYVGQVLDRNKRSTLSTEDRVERTPTVIDVVPESSSKSILERAKEDQSSPGAQAKPDRFGRRRFGLNTPSAYPARWEAGHGTNTQYAHLLQTTTTEHDDGKSGDLPEMPNWVKAGVKYACQRATPKDSPNEVFIELLKKIKLARLLTNDEIGVRAYSTSIAALAAYPYRISNPREIMALPGCDAKIANLYVEWANTGKIQAVEDLDADEDLKVLRTFYEIWGVGATTAREFYYDRGWRDLDDVVEYGWKTLSRVQQIGVKFYAEFQDPIPRAEVAAIGRTIHAHAVAVRDAGIQTMLVGGYRRGKAASGDVDIVVSHPDEARTADLAADLVASLEDADCITHTLLLALTTSHRGQQALPFRAGGGGHGFDSLDKALVVWQDPRWKRTPGTEGGKNPNIHRRVDIIIAPWRAVGCAVVGWSGGTTFERDLRRYAKNIKGWKFDSSGVRDRGNGEVMDLEGYYSWKGREGENGRAKTMEEAERRVFEGFGLEWREPWERCTG